MTVVGLVVQIGGTRPSVVDQIQGLATTPREQWIATVLIIGGFVLFSAVGYAIGSVLNRWMDDTNTEAVQSVLVTAAGIVAAGLLVVVWGAFDSVARALAAIEPDPTTGVKLLLVALAFAASYSVTRITKGLIRIGEGRDAITNHQREVLHHVVQIVVFLPAVVFSLALFEVGASDLVLSAGAAGVVLGLAARQTLGSVIAGFVLLFSRPFEVGDWVQVDENEGIVTDVSIINTRLRTFDDEHVMLPNDHITDSAVTNLSRNDRLRVQVDVGVDYEADVEHAARVAVEAMESCDQVLAGRSPDVVLKGFGDSAILLTLRFWIDDPTIRRKWAAQNAVIEAVKTAYEQEDIKIPYPQRELAGREEAGGFRLTGEAVAVGGDAGRGGATGSESGAGTTRDRDAEPAVEPATDGEPTQETSDTDSGDGMSGGRSEDDSREEDEDAGSTDDVLRDVTATATDVHPNALEPAIVRVDDEEGAGDAPGDEND